MRVHVLQHVAFEGLGSIAAWLEDRQAEVTCTRFYESAELPDSDAADVVIALGGPMSVNDDDQFPWLQAEKHFIAEAIGKNKIILGICLGCQLIANALGAGVYPGAEKEIGWFPVFADQHAGPGIVLPPSFTAFHWHGETFELPSGAVRLASSALYPNQAFRIERRILGLQFHLETTRESAEELIRHGRDELLPARYVQSERQIRDVGGRQYDHLREKMYGILQQLISV